MKCLSDDRNFWKRLNSRKKAAIVGLGIILLVTVILSVTLSVDPQTESGETINLLQLEDAKNVIISL